MELTEQQLDTLCKWIGILKTDEKAVAVAKRCYQRAYSWFENAGCDPDDDAVTDWVYDLAAWFHDNRGRSDAEIPPYIVQNVHNLR